MLDRPGLIDSSIAKAVSLNSEGFLAMELDEQVIACINGAQADRHPMRKERHIQLHAWRFRVRQSVNCVQAASAAMDRSAIEPPRPLAPVPSQ